MASTALNSRSIEAMVTSRPETSTATSPMNGQDVPSTYLAQYTATLEDFARRNAGNLLNASSVTRAASPAGEEVTTEDEDGSCDDNSSAGQKSSIASPLDSAKKRRKQSKPNKIGGSDGGSAEGEEMDIDDAEKSRANVLETSLTNPDSELRDNKVGEDGGLSFKCPHCQVSVHSHEALRSHIIEEHLGRMLSEDELLLRHAHITNQKLLEEQQQQQQLQFHRYQQHVFAETLRIQNEQNAKRREEKEHLKMKQQQQQQDSQANSENHHERISLDHQILPHPLHVQHQQQQQQQQQHQQQQQQQQQQRQQQQHHQQPQPPHQRPQHTENQATYEREEGETGPLNLSSPRWDNRSNPSQDPQRSPVTPLPASIPMPPSFVDARFNLPGLLPFGPPPFLLPFMQQNDRDNSLNPSQPGSFNPGQSRIFNQEAFCDLCNKEFCNKYFLKTHKANKHGIFTPEPSCSPMPPTPPNPIGSSTPLSSNAQLLAPLVHSPMTPTSMGGSPYAGAFLTANLGNLAALRPPHPIQIPMTPKSQSSSSKSDASSVSKSGVINLDAYCELCQKEFCNKYFLKRHKLKIHGVNIEVTIKSPKTNPNLDRPEGWCDACRRNIGSRSALNAHKLHAHGPHIVNHMPVSEAPIRHPMDFRPHNVLPVKQRKPDRDLKDNFSPWDTMMRDRDTLENPMLWNKRPKSFDGTSPRANEASDVSEGKQLGENNSFDDKPNTQQMSPGSSEPYFKGNNSGILMNDSMFSQFNDVRKVKIPQTNGVMEENQGDVEVKIEPKSTDCNPTVSKDRGENDSDPPMPVLKPQNDGEREMDISQEANEFEDRAPPVLKEQAVPLSRPHEEEMQEAEHLASEPPRTPGGISNSTDDSSREAGIIARVGQPAIVQAPPGTKFTTEQLRQLGVINPDAFCELCCKEFCNKYFLRTHRLKKHNIYTPEYSERSKQHFKDSTPANLSRIFERQSLECRPPNPNEMELETECNICRRSFASPYILHMHKFYFHGPGSEVLPSDPIPMPEHVLSQEQLRQIAMQAHHQKIQEHHQFILRQQKHHENQMQLEQQKSKEPKTHVPESMHNFNSAASEDNSQMQQHGEVSNLSADLFDKPSHMNERSTENKPDEGLRLVKTPELKHNTNSSPNGEADTSQELRKLQSMILELNRHGEEGIVCKVCQKEIGNKYFLRGHMLSEHGIILQDEHINSESAHTPKTPFELNGRIPSPLSSPATDSQAYCEICKKDFFSRYILQQHMLSAHGVFTQHPGPTSFLDRIRAEVEGREERKPQSVSRSFCDICNKELCNKYFMKTHMLKMHGINIENGTSGGVTCDICNKELCSKYFLKVHRQNTHGLVEDLREGRDLKEMPPKDGETEENPGDPTAIEMCPLCKRKFKNIKWLRTHLTQDHGEEGKMKWRELEPNYPSLDALPQNCPNCNICGKSQPDLVSLQLHIIKFHGGKQSDENSEDDSRMSVQCSTCSFVCRSPALLAAHERSHSPGLHIKNNFPSSSNIFQCQVCPQILPNIETLQQHLIGHRLQGLFEPLLTKEHVKQEKVTEERVLYSFKKTGKRWKCRKCSMSFKIRSSCLVHVFSRHSNRPNRNVAVTKPFWGRKTFKCRKCGVSERRLGDLLTHLRSHCKNMKQISLPVTQAEPFDPSISDHEFMMQSFLMNKEHDEGGDEHFVPSLVRLPVSRLVHQPLTVSFTLTPA